VVAWPGSGFSRFSAMVAEMGVVVPAIDKTSQSAGSRAVVAATARCTCPVAPSRAGHPTSLGTGEALMTGPAVHHRTIMMLDITDFPEVARRLLVVRNQGVTNLLLWRLSRYVEA